MEVQPHAILGVTVIFGIMVLPLETTSYISDKPALKNGQKTKEKEEG